MMQSEFEKLIGRRVDDDDYRVIEYVYTWHPAIDNVRGKQQIADLYKIGGMGVISDMIRTAKLAERLENKICAIRGQIRDLQQEIETLSGHMDELKNGTYAVRELDREED